MEKNNIEINDGDLTLKIAKIQARIMAFVMAIMCGLIIFLATAWLIIKGGENVGSHLQLLSNFFPGYTVSWIGSLIGALYGLVTGAAIGWLIGFLYFVLVKIRNT